jgi:GT2 family glycosyltransferase
MEKQAVVTTDNRSTLGIIVISFNVRKLLQECLESIYRQTRRTRFEIWVIDNDSRDDSVRMLREKFPAVHLIENRQNLGFTRANNQAIAQCRSDLILLLNPDTLILDGALDKMVQFMDEHPEVGVSGCRVQNEDGSLQLACRRSLPTPRVAFYRLTGLSRLFPRSQVMARYNLTYVDPNRPHEVDAVSGAFLLIRRQVVEQIGLLDEQFWIFGEDIDWCIRAQRAGWKVMYNSDARILHYKGIGCSTNRRQTSFEFYRAMSLFHRKHFAADCPWVLNSLIYAGIACQATVALRRLVLPGQFTAGGRERQTWPAPAEPQGPQAMGSAAAISAERPTGAHAHPPVAVVPYRPASAEPSRPVPQEKPSGLA